MREPQVERHVVDARGEVVDLAVGDAEIDGELERRSLHAVTQPDRPDRRRARDRAAVDRHRVRVVQEPHVGAQLFHVGAHVEQHGDRAQPPHDAADPERVGDRLAQPEPLRHLEVGHRARLVAADLDHVDGVVGAVERGAPVGGRGDLGRARRARRPPRRPTSSEVARRWASMSNSAISESASSAWLRMSPSRLRANTVLPAPMNVIFAMAPRLRPATRIGLRRRPNPLLDEGQKSGSRFDERRACTPRCRRTAAGEGVSVMYRRGVSRDEPSARRAAVRR